MPDKPVLDKFDEIAAAAVARARQKQAQPFAVARKQVSDSVFKTMEFAQEYVANLSRSGKLKGLPQAYEVPQFVDDQKMDSAKIPPTAGIVLATGAIVATDWKTLDVKTLPDATKKTVDTLVAEILTNGKDIDTLVRQHPLWLGPLRALADDATMTGECISQMMQGLDPILDESEGTFTVEQYPERNPQIAAISVGILARMRELCDKDRKRLLQEMKEWKRWVPLIQPAKSKHVKKAHEVYKSAEMTDREFVSLDPRYGDAGQQAAIVAAVQSHGRMLNPLIQGGSSDEIFEGVRRGKVFIIKEDGNVIGFYNMLLQKEAVERHMASELLFNPNKSYTSTEQLPQFTQLPDEKNGAPRTRSIRYVDPQSALMVFQLAREGKLVWSVDHAVKPEPAEDGEVRRFAQAGTALKMTGYGHAHEKGKQGVLLKIFKIKGIDASKAAKRLSIAEQGGVSAPKDESGLIRLLNPLINTGSMVVNTRLGAYVVFVVDEEFELPNGVRVLVEWQYLYNPFPAKDPSVRPGA